MSCTKNSEKTSNTADDLQVQRRIPVDVHRVRLYIKAALQKKADNFMVTKTSTEVEGDVIFIVLGIHWWGEYKC